MQPNDKQIQLNCDDSRGDMSASLSSQISYKIMADGFGTTYHMRAPQIRSSNTRGLWLQTKSHCVTAQKSKAKFVAN
jgi:hypothetical protein